MTYIVGIDPGKTGAACVIKVIKGDTHIVEIYPFKSKSKFLEVQVFGMLMDGLQEDDTAVYLERVHAMPGQGGGSMFSFGVAVGYVKGILEAFGHQYAEVTPQCWQKELGLSTPYPTKYQRKQAHLRLAKKLYPNLDIKLEEADAVLIAEYGRRINNVA